VRYGLWLWHKNGLQVARAEVASCSQHNGVLAPLRENNVGTNKKDILSDLEKKGILQQNKSHFHELPPQV
jgi:hypothetical protein